MSWDEKAERWASALYPDVPLPKEAGKLRDLGVKINATAADQRQSFIAGAGWRDKHLRSDEAVERVANILHSNDHGETLDHHDAVCERDRGGCDRREIYMDSARAEITALLGEDPR